jgi:hypothetical protein
MQDRLQNRLQSCSGKSRGFVDAGVSGEIESFSK